MSENPFEVIASAINGLRKTTDEILARLKSPPTEWIGMPDAMATRRKGRRVLMRDVAEGRIRARREPGRGKNTNILLNREDLDQLYPERR